MEQRPLEYTVKIYCEGFTEWYYFEWLRTSSRFRFSMEPDVPKNSRSSYKQNLKLIDKELRKNPQERADAVQPDMDGHRSLSVMQGEDCICMLKYDGAKLRCLFASGQSFDIDDTRPLDISDPVVELIAGLVK
jgi:hypothetical protein